MINAALAFQLCQAFINSDFTPIEVAYFSLGFEHDELAGQLYQIENDEPELLSEDEKELVAAIQYRMEEISELKLKLAELMEETSPA